MEINLASTVEVDGKIERQVTIADSHDSGPIDSLVLTVWVIPEDSRAVVAARTREATIAFLERALAALRRG